jgi:hypothetical protein
MRESTQTLSSLTADEYQLLRDALLLFRNSLLSKGRSADAVNELLIKIYNITKQKAVGAIRRLFAPEGSDI